MPLSKILALSRKAQKVDSTFLLFDTMSAGFISFGDVVANNSGNKEGMPKKRRES